MYELRHHQHHSSKKSLLIEWVASLGLAVIIVAGIWWFVAGAVSVETPRQKEKASQAKVEAAETCIVVGGKNHGSQAEVCPDPE